MSLTLYDIGAIRVEVKYVLKKGNVYYFRRRIPDDVRRQYPGKNGQIFRSLKTSDPKVAAREADRLARQQDALWAAHRGGQVEHGPEVHATALAILEAHSLKPGQHREYARHDLEPDDFLAELNHQSGNRPG